MASFKVMPTSSTPPPPPPPSNPCNLNSDISSLQYHHHNLRRSFSSSSSSMMISPPDHHQQPTATVLDTPEITLIDAAGAISAPEDCGEPSIRRRTVDDVWREIVSKKGERKECKIETPDDMITLEDFLAKTGAGIDGGGDDDDEGDHGDHVVEDVKGIDTNAPHVSVVVGGMVDRVGSGGAGFGGGYDHQISYTGLNVADCGGGGVFGNGSRSVEAVGGRGKRRGGPILEPLDKAAQQRQRRMIKNRESAARSRERKQAYQVELESLAAKLEEENEQLQREKVERAKERYRQLMEKVIPVVEKRRPPRLIRRVQSTQW